MPRQIDIPSKDIPGAKDNTSGFEVDKDFLDRLQR